MSNYTLEDIGKFINDYKKCQGLKQAGWMLNIPFAGRKIYERACLENYKREFFERKYKEALTASIEEQQVFIEKMTPVLDGFYGNNKAKSK